MTNVPNDQRRLTSKQRAFAEAVALKNQSFTDAYRKAYNAEKMSVKGVHDAASKLAAHPDVAQRIEVLRQRATAAATAKAAFGITEAMAEADDAKAFAKSVGQAGALVAAMTHKAKLAGLLVERKEVRSGPLTDVDIDKLLSMKAAAEEKLAAIRAADEMAGVAAEAPAPVMRRVIG